jgi:hypothetical protein
MFISSTEDVNYEVKLLRSMGISMHWRFLNLMEKQEIIGIYQLEYPIELYMTKFATVHQIDKIKWFFIFEDKHLSNTYMILQQAK